ncbi:hypothetical protein [Corynebacterium cystitidis]|uniref:Uncharacterized protein n=1 Tax=Corynebacterium cystitidis DSM 20524 TaxID=1121357 RepID=A0A1H9U5J3_9CORY|nr:hypothetical protein [Corynebacterium cystitidis]WJY81169.1 hypothetical protein CCYS_00925 [Corynebacterium cystitidis DSM 20524]SES04343.1 hypothetical protein SAMN05661109_01655 [Corynebacterium cystitidis DSM 20524]SNV89672.1 Uncharacterised protein [Corynebacterium cystitidis]
MEHGSSQEATQEITYEAIDYNALDNTTGGRALQAGFIGALVAVPDYAHSATARWVARGTIAVANLATVAAFNAFDEDPRNDLTAVLQREERNDDAPVASVATTWGVIVALLLIAAVVVAGGSRVEQALGTWLGAKGVAKPHSVLGLATSALAFAAMEAQARRPLPVGATD